MQEHKHNHYGLEAENFFMATLNNLGIDYKKVNKTWFDFLVNNIKVEVKSCCLTIRQKKAPKGKTEYRSGHFDFTSKENRKNQYKENIWVCFIVRHEDNFMMLGFVKARELKKRRYVCVHKLRELNLVPLMEWIFKIKENTNI